MLVLVLLFMLAVCSSESYVDTDILHEQGLKSLVLLYNRKDEYYDSYKIAYNHYISRTTSEDVEYKLVFLSVANPFAANASQPLNMIEQQWQPQLQTLRRDEYASVIQVAEDGQNFIASYTTQAYVIVESRINICRTTFIVLVLGLASIYFTKDAQELVLDPLERMIEKIKAIAKNPLVAATEEVNEAGVMSFMSANQGENRLSVKDKKE